MTRGQALIFGWTISLTVHSLLSCWFWIIGFLAGFCPLIFLCAVVLCLSNWHPAVIIARVCQLIVWSKCVWALFLTCFSLSASHCGFFLLHFFVIFYAYLCSSVVVLYYIFQSVVQSCTCKRIIAYHIETHFVNEMAFFFHVLIYFPFKQEDGVGHIETTNRL